MCMSLLLRPSIRRETEHNHVSWSSAFINFNEMVFIQVLECAASLLILLTQTPLLHMDGISVEPQSFCFSFVFDQSCAPLVLHSHLGHLPDSSISPLKGSCVRCSSVSWHQTGGLETTGRMGHSTELRLKTGLCTCAEGFLSSQQQIWPIVTDSRADFTCWNLRNWDLRRAMLS